MRLIITTTPTTGRGIDFAYQQKMVGVIHSWIGFNNDLHGALSLYSFSWLHGGG